MDYTGKMEVSVKKILFSGLIIAMFLFTACGKKPVNQDSSASSEASLSSITEASASETKSDKSEVSSETSSSLDTSASVSEASSKEDTSASVTGKDSLGAFKEDLFLKDYPDFAGEYIDSYSERASMVIENFGYQLGITITWAESAYKTNEWEMTASLKDGKLVYTDCCMIEEDYTNEDDPEFEVAYMNGSGYFEVDGGKLKWTGAQDYGCADCVFEKMP